MGSSTVTVQSVFDFLKSMGETDTVLPVGGWSTANCLTIATDVMNDLIAERFNFKWNRFRCKPFYTVTYATDYAQVGITNIGWIESARWKDINSTSTPQPEWSVEAVQDLETTSIVGNPPGKVAWYPNDQLDQGAWPGASKIYTQPFGATTTPENPPINILDPSGNILVLTIYGTTGATAPDAGPDADEGTQVTDGTCTWTVASPDSQGFRLWPRSSQHPVVYQVLVTAQRKAPPAFVKMNQFINPVPDDYAHYFRTGCRIHSYKISPNPKAQTLYPSLRTEWLASMQSATKQADRELGNAGFIPDRSVVAGTGDGYDVGPANPYGWQTWPGGNA
jgi:hypothetical protein